MEKDELDKMIHEKIVSLVRDKGFTNPSLIAGVVQGSWCESLGLKSVGYRFGELRKMAEVQYQLYQQELSRKNI